MIVDTASVLAAGYERLYFQINLVRPVGPSPGVLHLIYDQLRPHYEGCLKDVLAETQDRSTYSLLLLGAKGTGTGWHRDWSEARNVAYRLDDGKSGKKLRPKLGEPLACWALITPGQEEVVQKWQVDCCINQSPICSLLLKVDALFCCF